jgi:hypothetical protein
LFIVHVKLKKKLVVVDSDSFLGVVNIDNENDFLESLPGHAKIKNFYNFTLELVNC